MSEQLNNQENVHENVQESQEAQQSIPNPFDESNWVDTNSENEEYQEQNVNDSNVSNEGLEEEVVDADEYLKQNLGFSSWEEAKEEIEKLKSGASSYENETSAIIHKALSEGNIDQVYNYLEQTRYLNNLLGSDINDENASEIVKLNMKLKYSDLSDDEINYKFNKQFKFPKEPEQAYDETDSEFEDRKKEWEMQVKETKMELMIEAKTARPQLEQLREEIKLPNIEDNFRANLSQEELAGLEKYIDSYYQAAETSINSFDGFSVEYRDEDGSVQTAYVPSSEEKEFVAAQLEHLAESNFDANAIFAQRWVNDDGTLNTSQITRDIVLLHSEEKIMQKLVNDSVAKRMADYRQKTSNIKVNGGQARGGGFEKKGDSTSQMADFFFSV